ncbi:MAG: hypothetical protein K0Q76_4152 [Panacagrimonas sp.]|jgi:hypothetical protein|nr:hypothetical protein [Panacagrimonas sp.]MCC2659044.1 hypothetical protein [Panacagrimonas sp.]
MATAPGPVRLDAEITEAARIAASRMSRSVAQQVSHWARIGRELERAGDVSAEDIRRVLVGQAGYDALAPKEQAMVRAVWSGRIDQLRAELRLDSLYAERGYQYAELDERGEVVVQGKGPGPASRPRAMARPTRATAKKKSAGR